MFAISGSSKNYFLEPVSQTNLGSCTAPTSVSLYMHGGTGPVFNGQITYYFTSSGSQNGGSQINWNPMTLPDGLTSGSYYFQVQRPSCRTGVTMALFKTG